MTDLKKPKQKTTFSIGNFNLFIFIMSDLIYGDWFIIMQINFSFSICIFTIPLVYFTFFFISLSLESLKLNS